MQGRVVDANNLFQLANGVGVGRAGDVGNLVLHVVALDVYHFHVGFGRAVLLFLHMHQLGKEILFIGKRLIAEQTLLQHQRQHAADYVIDADQHIQLFTPRIVHHEHQRRALIRQFHQYVQPDVPASARCVTYFDISNSRLSDNVFYFPK